MSRRHLNASRSNRKLVVESSSARNSMSTQEDHRSSIADRRRAMAVRRKDSSRGFYTPNRSMYGGGVVSQRSQRLLAKTQNETSSSALRFSDPDGHWSEHGLEQYGNGQNRPMSCPNRQLSQQQLYPNEMYPPGYPQQNYSNQAFPPNVLYASQACGGSDDAYQSFLSRQYQINEMQRQEEFRKADHERRLAEAAMVKQQQQEMELKNAMMEQEKEKEKLRIQEEAQRLEDEELKRLEAAEKLREDIRKSNDGTRPSSNLINLPKEVYLSNDDLLAALVDVQKEISKSARKETSDDELLEMFQRLQMLQDILEKRDVEIDAAHRLARTFRRQSLRRKSDIEEKPPARNSFSRRKSLERRKSGNVDLDPDSIKTLSRRDSSDSCHSKKLSRRDSREDPTVEGIYMRKNSSDEILQEDPALMEEDPRVLKLQNEISTLSNIILSKSFNDKTLLTMFDQLEYLKGELATLKGIELPPEAEDHIYEYNPEKREIYERAQLKVNPQYKEIKKLKPVLRRLLPARTQFARIEELFSVDYDRGSEVSKTSSHFNPSLTTMDHPSDEEEYYDDYDRDDGIVNDSDPFDVVDNVNESDESCQHFEKRLSPMCTLDVIQEDSEDEVDDNEDMDAFGAKMLRASANSSMQYSHRGGFGNEATNVSSVRANDRLSAENIHHSTTSHIKVDDKAESKVSCVANLENSIYDVSGENEVKESLMEFENNKMQRERVPSFDPVCCADESPLSSRNSFSSTNSHCEETPVNRVDNISENSPSISSIVDLESESRQDESKLIPNNDKVNIESPSNLKKINEAVKVSPQELNGKSDKGKNIDSKVGLGPQRRQPKAPSSVQPLRSMPISEKPKAEKSSPATKPRGIIGNASSDRPLSMEISDKKKKKGRFMSGFFMGNPMTSSTPSTDDSRDSSGSARSSYSSTNSIDRLPHGVNSYRKANLDIFQSKSKRK